MLKGAEQMHLSMNIWDLSEHQLDVIRTLGSVVGALGGLAGGLAAIGAFLAKGWAKQAATNTQSTKWQDGRLVTQPVAETARHAAIDGEATRHEVGELTEWVKGRGRRRLPTGEIPSAEEFRP